MWLERLGTGMGTGKEGRDVGKRKLGDVCAVVDRQSRGEDLLEIFVRFFFFGTLGGSYPARFVTHYVCT